MANIATGTYLGNGVASQDIVTGFRPQLVIAIRDGADGPFTIEDIAAVQGFFRYLQDGFYAGSPNGYTILANGFRVGTNATINAAGVTYHYIALGSGICEVGGQAGDGTNGRLIPTSFTPGVAWIWARNVDGVRPLIQRSYLTAAGQERRLSNGALAMGTLVSIEAGGFRVDNNAWSNAAGTDYVWAVFPRNTGGERSVQYPGDGNDNRDIFIAALDVKCSCILVEDGGAENAYAFIRSDTMAVDASQTVIPGIGFTANFIQDEALKNVQIGNGALNGVNPRHVNTIGRTYHLMALGNTVSGGGKIPKRLH